VIFTDWIVGWDSVTRQWHKVHVTVDTQKLADALLGAALKNHGKAGTGYHRLTTLRGGVVLEVQRGVTVT
jgi:hypothetical protein